MNQSERLTPISPGGRQAYNVRLSSDERKFILNVDKERLKDAPGFDKDNWPETSDRAFGTKVYSYYGCTYVPRPS